MSLAEADIGLIGLGSAGLALSRPDPEIEAVDAPEAGAAIAVDGRSIKDPLSANVRGAVAEAVAAAASGTGSPGIG